MYIPTYFSSKFRPDSKMMLLIFLCFTFSIIDGKKSFTAVTYDVGGKFLKALNKPFSNALFSPSTLTATYALVYATSQGQLKSEINNLVFLNWTEQEIYDATRRYMASTSSKKFKSVEKIFYQQDTAPGPLPSRELNQLISDVFNTTVDKVDFENNIDLSRSLINQWVSDKTRNKIRQLFGPSDLKNDAIMVLASAAAFDTSFTYGFPSNNTKQQFFYSNANTASVNYFMSQTCVRFFYGETSQAIAVGLPYGSKEQAVAFFIMPKEKYGLQALEDKIANEDHLTEILDNSVDYSKVVMLTLPRFKLNLDPYNIRPTLMIMGTTTMFAQGFVDFSKINSRKNLYVTHAAHKAFFEAKEGASRLCPNDGTSDLDKVSVTFNQPFILAVVEKSTRNLLLYGHVMSLD